MPPINALATNVMARGYVPMDDTHTMIVAVEMKGARAGRGERNITGASQNFPYLPNTTDWFGRWRLRANFENDFEIDRGLQRTKSYSGIEGVQLQDHAIQVSIGRDQRPLALNSWPPATLWSCGCGGCCIAQRSIISATAHCRRAPAMGTFSPMSVAGTTWRNRGRIGSRRIGRSLPLRQPKLFASQRNRPR